MIKDTYVCLGLSQMIFAEQLDVAVVTANRWENGRRRPSSVAMKKLVDLCRH